MSDGAGVSGTALQSAGQQQALQNTSAMMPQVAAQNLPASSINTSALSSGLGLQQPQSNAISPETMKLFSGGEQTAQPAQQSGLSGVPSSYADKGDKPWYNGILHGGGDGRMTDTEIDRTSRLSDLIGKTSDPTLKNQYQQQLNEIQAGAQDRGGIVGSIGRMMTGKGQGGMENMGTAGLAVAMPIIKALIAKKTADGLTDKVLANQNKVRANQQQWANSQFL